MNYCLSQGGQHAAPEHIALLSACADICATRADAMLTGASVSPVICGTCAEVCRTCAQSCERMGDDAQMKHCAEVCMRCAASCATMVASRCNRLSCWPRSTGRSFKATAQFSRTEERRSGKEGGGQ